MPRRVIQIRADEELMGNLRRLAGLWGGIRPLPIAEVVREMARRTVKAEAKRSRPFGANQHGDPEG